MKESSEDEVKLQAIHSRGLEPLLEFIYGSALDVNENNLMEVFGVAEYLQVEAATEICVQYMESTLNEENCVDYLQIAETYNCVKMVKRIDRFISNRISKWAENNKHKSFPFNIIKQHVSRAEDIAEVFLYNFVTGWLAENEVTEAEVRELLDCLKFHCMPNLDLEEIVTTEPAASNVYIQEKIREAWKYREEGSTLKERMRIGTPENFVRDRHLVLAFGGIKVSYRGRDKTKHTAETDLFQVNFGGAWYKAGVPWPQFSKSAITNHRGMIFACGGLVQPHPHRPYVPCDTCHMFDPILWRWEKIANLNEKRYELAVAGHGDFIYAFGGQAIMDQGASKTVERYLLREDRWEQVATMPCAAHDLAAAGDGQFLYIYGGKSDKDENLDIFLRHDPQSHDWKELPVPEFTRHGCFLFACWDHLILIKPGSSKIAVFSKSTAQWSYLDDLYGLILTSESFVSLVESTFFFIGGFSLSAERGKEFSECLLTTLEQDTNSQPKIRGNSVITRRGNICGPMCAAIPVPYHRTRSLMGLTPDDRRRWREELFSSLLDVWYIPIPLWHQGSHSSKISNIRCTKVQNLNVSHLVLQLSLPNPLKPGVK